MAKQSKGLGYIRKIKRKNGWYYQGVISLGYKPDGKQDRKTKGSYNQQEVIDWLKDMNDKIFTGKTEMLVKDYAYKYLDEEKKDGVKYTTYEKYLTRIRLYIEPYPLGDMKVGNVNQAVANQYANKLLKDSSIPIHNFMVAYLKTMTLKK